MEREEPAPKVTAGMWALFQGTRLVLSQVQLVFKDTILERQCRGWKVTDRLESYKVHNARYSFLMLDLTGAEVPLLGSRVRGSDSCRHLERYPIALIIWASSENRPTRGRIGGRSKILVQRTGGRSWGKEWSFLPCLSATGPWRPQDVGDSTVRSLETGVWLEIKSWAPPSL